MSPFDKARYERLLEGLEVTEKQLSELERTWRIDAEFFQRRHLRLAEQLQKHRLESTAQVAAVSDGNHFSISESFVEEGIPYYRGQDVAGHFFIEQATANAITREAFEQPFMKRSHLQQGDVLLSIIGTVGETSLVKTAREATCSCKLAILRPQAISPEYLAAYLSSPVGKSLTERWKRGAVQTGLLLEDMDQIPVARFSSRFEDAIKSAVDAAFASLESGRHLLQQAEQALLHALGLDTWTPPEALSYVRSSREAFAAGRFDAEYFHPAKAQALVDLRALSDVCVGDLFDSIRDLWQPTEAAGLPVRNYDLTDALDPFLDPSKPTTAPEEIASTKKCIAAGDLVVSRLRSYLQEIAVVLPSDDGITAVASTEFIVLRPKEGTTLTVEALLIYLRSRLPQIVFKWSQDGSNHPRFDERELLNLPVPRALITDQAVYHTAVRQMVKQRQRATRLLEAAKRAVEIAIEDSEAAALAHLAAANPPDAAA